MCAGHLVIETVTALYPETLPAMRLFRPGELDGDTTNFWAPNLAALEVMLTTFGFSKIEFLPSPVSLSHPLRKQQGLSFRKKEKSKAVYRTIIHATR